MTTAAKGKALMLTDEQEREFERLKLLIRQGRFWYIPELLTVIGILDSIEAKNLRARVWGC